MTQYEQVARLLNGLMYPASVTEIVKVLELPRPTVRRILGELRQAGELVTYGG